MPPQAVEALAAEAGDQAGVDVQDAPGVAGGKIRRQNCHKARQDNQLDTVGRKDFLQLRLKRRLGAAFPLCHQGGVDARLLRPLQGIGSGVVGHHQHDFAADQGLSLGVDQRL